MDDDKIDGLIGTIYETVAEPAAWDTLLRRLKILVPSGTAIAWSQDLGSGEFPLFRGEIDPDAVTLYAAYYAAHDAWVAKGARQFRPGQAVVGDSYLPRAELIRTEFYNDYCKRFGFDQVLSGMIAKSHREFGAVALFRSERDAPFTADELRLMKRISPHAHRAFRIAVKLREAQDGRTMLADALHRGPVALAIIDRFGRTVFTNARADAILREGDGIGIRGGALHVMDREAAAALARLIAAAAMPPGGAAEDYWGQTLAVPRVSGEAPYLLTVMPSRLPDRPADGRVLITLEIPVPRILPESYLRQRYELSAGEARVVRALAEGQSPEDIAEHSQVSRHTVSTLLRRAMRKTGTRRRADLVRLAIR